MGQLADLETPQQKLGYVADTLAQAAKDVLLEWVQSGDLYDDLTEAIAKNPTNPKAELIKKFAKMTLSDAAKKMGVDALEEYGFTQDDAEKFIEIVSEIPTTPADIAILVAKVSGPMIIDGFTELSKFKERVEASLDTRSNEDKVGDLLPGLNDADALNDARDVIAMTGVAETLPGAKHEAGDLDPLGLGRMTGKETGDVPSLSDALKDYAAAQPTSPNGKSTVSQDQLGQWGGDNTGITGTGTAQTGPTPSGSDTGQTGTSPVDTSDRHGAEEPGGVGTQDVNINNIGDGNDQSEKNGGTSEEGKSSTGGEDPGKGKSGGNDPKDPGKDKGGGDGPIDPGKGKGGDAPNDPGKGGGTTPLINLDDVPVGGEPMDPPTEWYDPKTGTFWPGGRNPDAPPKPDQPAPTPAPAPAPEKPAVVPPSNGESETDGYTPDQDAENGGVAVDLDPFAFMDQSNDGLILTDESLEGGATPIDVLGTFNKMAQLTWDVVSLPGGPGEDDGQGDLGDVIDDILDEPQDIWTTGTHQMGGDPVPEPFDPDNPLGPVGTGHYDDML